MRQGIDIEFVPEVLGKVQSVDDAGFVDGVFYGSLVARIAAVIRAHISTDRNGASEIHKATEERNRLVVEHCAPSRA